MTHTILLVEDEDNDAFFFKSAVRKAAIECQLHVACDGRQALDYFQAVGKYEDRQQFPLPNLVFLDLKLPRVMGLDVLAWIRQNPKLSPIILILSSSSDHADVANAYRLGANGYLVKPPDVSQLMRMVACASEFWLQHNTQPEALDSPALALH
jgi:CheY-like chemotaxis protein